MKKTLLSTVALLTLSAGAMAADLPSRRMAPAPFVAAVPVFTWTGFYFGVNAGYGFSDHNNDDTINFDANTFGGGTGGGRITFNDSGSGDTDGFVGGAQVGFNYQFTPGTGFVVGLEADIQAVDFERERGDGGFTLTSADRVTVANANAVGFQAIRNDVSSLDYFGTVRGRLGYAFDRTLVYATGGFAYGDGDRNSDCQRFSFNSCRRGSDDMRYGYAVGGGVEFALPITASLFGSSAMTFKIEGLYVNLEEDGDGRRGDFLGITTRDAVSNTGRFVQAGTAVFNGANFNQDGGTGRSVRAERDDKFDFAVIRAGINFKF